MASVLNVAQYVLNKVGDMTTLKLQKLVYYCQAWSLAWDGKPLFDEEFEAWANGPVCPELFKKHKGKFVIEKNFLDEYKYDKFTGEEKEETYEVEIPIETYNKLLEARGKDKLSECTKIETFDCVISNTNNLIYRTDYDLGDKVSIINKKWGLMLNERIISITETYDSEGLNIDIEIGNNIPTLIEKIKRKMR